VDKDILVIVIDYRKTIQEEDYTRRKLYKRKTIQEEVSERIIPPWSERG
jgi:hypothetical protein